MKMSELIAEIGDDNIGIQNLDTCNIDINWDHKKGTVIKFGSEEPVDFNGTRRLGIIVWLDRDAVKKALAKT